MADFLRQSKAVIIIEYRQSRIRVPGAALIHRRPQLRKLSTTAGEAARQLAVVPVVADQIAQLVER